MSARLKVLFLSSEVVPFSKSGGLADVAGALPEALARVGCDVTVSTPFYGDLLNDRFHTTKVPGDPLTVTVDGEDYAPLVRTLPESSGPVRFLFVGNDELLGRPGLYGDASTDGNYPDNDVRFVFFCRSVLEWVRRSGERYDVIHLNDWQTAPVAAYLATLYADDPHFAATSCVLTIHNLAYQGVFPAERFGVLGLESGLFHPMSPFEFWGKVNFLKCGIHYAQKITTVSPTYAHEIQNDEEYGCGLGGVLRNRQADLSGILNGIDDAVWNPATDSLLVRTYDAATVTDGKRANKEALLERAGIPKARWSRPLIGIISRLADQKGFDLIAEAAGRLFAMDINLVLLGTGDPRFHELFTTLTRRHADRLKAFLTFDNTLAHQIEAGADIFLMPSRYEPCGLNQMYSLRYGTVPVVRATGGLADTVTDADADSQNGTGFVFKEYTLEAMLVAIRRALAAFPDRARWAAIQRRGMAGDFSWTHSASRYAALYREALRLDAGELIQHHSAADSRPR